MNNLSDYSEVSNTSSSPNESRELQGVIDPNTKVSPIGIDTVQIHVDDFAVEDRADFRVDDLPRQSTGKTKSVPLWETSSGEVVRGRSAFLNTTLLQVAVRRVDLMTVRASLPKLIYGNNNRPVSTTEEVKEALGELHEQLLQCGIDCTLKNQPLSRIELFRNVRTDAVLADLKPSLRRLGLETPYSETRYRGYDGINWVRRQKEGAPVSEVTFHDKSKEAGLPKPRIQRLTYVLQRKRAVQSRFGEYTIAENYTTGHLCGSLNPVRSVFREIVEELFPESLADKPTDIWSNGNFVGEEEDPTITSDRVCGLLSEIGSHHGQNCHALNWSVWAPLLSSHNDPEQLIDALEGTNGSDDGPTGGKHQVQDEVRPARRYAEKLNNDPASHREQLEALRSKLLS